MRLKNALNLLESKNIFFESNMAYIASGIIGVMFLIYCCYNGYFYLFKPSKYQGIRFTTKNIAYITMLSAVSVAVTIVVSVTFPITVLPPIRIAFEGLMVKITGFIFGPIVGLLSGVITDCLCLLFVPSYIHIAYLVVIASFGFLSGCIGVLNRSIGVHKWIMFFFVNAFLVIFGGLGIIATYLNASDQIQIFQGTSLSKEVLIYLIVAGTGSTIIILWLLMFYFNISKYRKRLWPSLLPIIALAIVNEYWVTTLISSWGDIAFLSASQGASKGYGATMISRLIMAPLKIIFNSAVIYITYRAIAPLINKDN